LYFEQKGLVDDKKQVPWDGPLEPRLKELKRKQLIHLENLRKMSERFNEKNKQQENKLEDT